MKWIGLTGGIATGKSTVAQMLRKSGYPVVDADEVARDVVKIGTPGLRKIVETFGRHYLLENGELDRKKIGELIFQDREKRFELERITHPLIQAKVKEIRADLEKEGNKVAFYDIPLLYEKDLAGDYDAVVVVACSAPAQLTRLMERTGLSKSEAASRIGSQIPILEKVALADYVIWNDGAAKDLEFEVGEFLKKLDFFKN